ncbi:MAG: hypothetical protein A07HR60_00112 [uncultured archaeon A07HR60]|nr:MAG: hypothetical protein A07HR60_00112 [uncultured archaeon A07HR60]
MSLPESVRESVGDEEVAADIPLGGEDQLVVTPSQTLVYRAQGLLSDESVTSYSHDADRIAVSDGRRKSKITLDYGMNGEESMKVPADRVEDALHPIVAGVLAAADIVDSAEQVLRTFRFSELSFVVTSQRVVKHIGAAVWDSDYKEFAYEDVTAVSFEEGTVATSVVLELADRQERFKAPNDAARMVRSALGDAVCAFHDVGSLEELRVVNEPDPAAKETPKESDSDPTDFGVGPDPLSMSSGGVGVESASDPETRDDAPDSESTPSASDSGSRSRQPDGAVGSKSNQESSGSSSRGSSAASDRSRGSTDNRPSTSGSRSQTNAGRRTRGSGEGQRDQQQSTTTNPSGSTGDSSDSSTDARGSGESPFEFSNPLESDISDEVAALKETVKEQSEQLEKQGQLLQQLIEELRKSR